MMPGMVAVRAHKEQGKSGFLAVEVDNNSSGIVEHLPPAVVSYDGMEKPSLYLTNLKPGMVVYFGTKRQQLVIDGTKYFVMNEDNIVAYEE